MSIVNKIKTWFGKQEQRELSSDERHEHSGHAPDGAGHKDHMMDRIDEIDQEIADDEGL